jgi:hypothetical protein
VILGAIFILLLSIGLLFTKEERLLKLKDYVFVLLRGKNSLYQGHQLYRWIDSHSSESTALNLGGAHKLGLPKKDCYREFGEFVHELWDDLRKGRAQVKRPLKALKMLLRSDLQRTRRERQVLASAYSQLFLMMAMVCLYLLSFDYFVKVSPPYEFWLGCILWQGLGAFVFFGLLKRKKEQVFSPLNDLLRGLQALNLLAFRGELNLTRLPNPRAKLKGDHLRYFEGLESAQESWRKQGRANLEVLDEFREDLALLAEDAQLNFLPWVKGLGFLWAMVFVLPLLFAGSLFGLYKLAVV